MLQLILTYQEAFLRGLGVTLSLAAITWGGGILIGLPLGLLSYQYLSVRLVVKSLSFILSGIPILVLLFWLHYPAQQILNIVVEPFYSSALALAMVNIFAVESIVYGAAANIPKEFRQAGIVCGLSEKQIFWQLELPLLIRGIISPILVSQVVALHMTLFASLISVDELLRMAQRINSQIYKPIEIYSILGLFFLLISLPINGLALVLKKRFGRDFSER
jgi:ABC-type amino acid transport system permease subunit